MRATLSVLGLYYVNQNLFADMHLPADVDAEIFRENLLAECAELEVLYTDPDFMQYIIGQWSAKELPVWTKLAETMHYEYDPIENYNRMESWGDNTTSNSQNITNGNTSVVDNTKTEGASEDTTKVAGFNGNDMGDREKVNNTHSDTNDYTSSSESSNTNNAESEVSSTHNGRIHGNIGVTTTQHMIKEQREIVELNLTNYIIDSFKRRFCLLVY